MNSLIENTRVYSTCWILFFFGFGILCYILDRQYLQGISKSIYDMTHKKPSEKPFGLIYGQTSGRKFLIATIVSTAQTFGLFFFTGFHSNPFVELVLWFVEIPAMVFGFAVGSFVWPWWAKRKTFYKVMDKIDEEVEKRTAGSAQAGNGKSDAASTTPPPPAPAAAAPVIPAKPEPSPEERIKAFTGKR